MAAERREPTPQQRLALSRRALIAQLQGDRRELPDGALYAVPPATVRPGGAFEPFAWRSVARGMVRRWWRRHPANAVGQVARPLLARYAREEPAKLVGAAAAAGALLVLVKPWRLLSLTAVLTAVMKTSDVADVVTTLMQKKADPRKKLP